MGNAHPPEAACTACGPKVVPSTRLRRAWANRDFPLVIGLCSRLGSLLGRE
jgi:hypothetical protein